MKKTVIVATLAAILGSPASAQAMQFTKGPWQFTAGINTIVLYGYNDYNKKYSEQNNRDETYSSTYVTLSAAYNFNNDYQLALYYLPNTSGTEYLQDYDGDQWVNQAYGSLQTPYGQIQAGLNYNVAYQFYVGAPALAPLYVNDSTITDFLTNPNWNRDGGKTAAYLTLNSTALNTDNIANKISYISPTIKGTTFGFSYMPSAYFNQGLVSGYAPYRHNDAYVAAISNNQQFGEVGLSTYMAYGLYNDYMKDFGVGGSVNYKNWTFGGSYRRSTPDGDKNPVNQQINPTLTPEFYDGYRDGYAWNMGLSYTLDKWTTAITYFESRAHKTENKDQFIQYLNQYKLNQYVTLYGAVGHVKFRGMTGTPEDSNEGYSFIAGFGIQI